MKKRVSLKHWCVVVFLVVSFTFIVDIAVTFAAPAPPTSSAIGNVQSVYVDRGRIRTAYYLIFKTDGTTLEPWSADDEIQKRIESAALHQKQVTVWYEASGEIYGASVNYHDPTL